MDMVLPASATPRPQFFRVIVRRDLALSDLSVEEFLSKPYYAGRLAPHFCVPVLTHSTFVPQACLGKAEVLEKRHHATQSGEF
jgi:hypothetical protein